MKKNKRIVLWCSIPISFLVLLIVFAATRERPGELIVNQGNRHLQSADEQHEVYQTHPPTSGSHLEAKASWGIHTEQIPDELQIHNLEDGGVIIHYDPAQVDEEAIQSLTRIVHNYKDKVILEPYANLETPVVLTAWTRIDKLSILDEERITDFINAYKGIDHHVPGS